jgi:cytochrome d ubiquinol oxidase subunit II
MFAAVILYAVFAGADFGSGTWDLIAGNARKGAPTRRLIDRAIGPVWEAHHVWLIFILVFLWTGFPRPFGTIMRELAIPFWLVGLGIVLRGSGFAFRKYSPDLAWARASGTMFAAASVVTPFFLGMIAGAVASGRVGSGNDGIVWLSPTSLIGGVLAVLTSTFLAGVFLAEEAQRIGDARLTESLRRRAMLLGAITGALALLAVIPLRSDAPTLADGLTGRAAPLILASAFAGASTLILLEQGHLRAARIAAVGAVASVVAGWGFGQYPWILVDEVSIEDGASNGATLVGLLIASAVAGAIVIPALVLLYRLADSSRLSTSQPPA